MGTDAREIAPRDSGVGSNAGTGLRTGPRVVKNAMPDGEDDDSSGSDAAQQRSASAWVTTLDAASSSEPDLCIGQGPSAVQQAMRASGLGIHPAQTSA